MMELTPTMITGAATILTSAIAFLYRRDANKNDAAIQNLTKQADECQNDRKKMGEKILDLSVEVAKMKVQSTLPCPLPECPKRNLIHPPKQDV